MMRRLPLAFLLLVLGVLTGSPAHADSRIAVSANGSSWSTALAAPLFDPAERWVPGDVRSSTFYVRNQATEAGTLAIEATAVDVDGLVAHHDITLAVRRDGGAWAQLPADGQPHRLSTPRLAAAAAARLDVRASFAPGSPNRSQSSRLRLDFRVLLTQAAAVAGPVDTDGDGGNGGNGGPGGLLPNTGGPARFVLVLGMGFIFIGSTIVFGLTRTRRTEGQQ